MKRPKYYIVMNGFIWTLSRRGYKRFLEMASNVESDYWDADILDKYGKRLDGKVFSPAKWETGVWQFMEKLRELNETRTQVS